MSIASRISTNPEIDHVNHADYLADLIIRVKDFIASYCNLPRYPELSQGFSRSKSNAETDLSDLSSNTFQISVNNSGYQSISLNLANCVNGIATAAELQTAIRSNSTYGFDEVSVTFNSDLKQYEILSGRYGQKSSVRIRFIEGSNHVCKALCLSPSYGGVEHIGCEDNQELDTVAVNLVEAKYRKLGIEGASSASISGAISINIHELDPTDKWVLQSNRRLGI